MASVFKRKSKDGKSFTWRAVVRINGYPTTCKTFERKQEAEDRIKLGQFKFDMHKQQHTFNDLMMRLYSDGALEYHRSLAKTRSQFEYWNQRLGHYALVHITPELISKERQLLIDTPTAKGSKRAAGTINRYMAVLSSIFNYAVKRIRWLNENPCANLLRIKDNARRDR